MRRFCLNGHEYSTENTRLTKRGRRCQICARKAGQRLRAKPEQKQKRNQYAKVWLRNNQWRPSVRYNCLLHDARQRNLPVSLTKVEHAIFIQQNCSYCGALPANTGSGVDRLDNNLGYHRENLVACCYGCNRKKGGLELAGFQFPRTVELMEELRLKVPLPCSCAACELSS